MDNSDLINRIENLCTQKGIKPNKALVESGAGKDFIYNARNGSEPSMTKIAKIASYFGVSTDYLLGNEQKNKPATERDELDPMDAKIMELFSKLNPANKKLALAQIEAIISSQDNG